MLRQQSNTPPSLIPSVSEIPRRLEPCSDRALRLLRPDNAIGAIAAHGFRASSRVFLSPFFNFDIFSGTGRRSILTEPSDAKGDSTGLSLGSFPRTFRLLLPARCTDPYRTFPVLSCAKWSQPLRNTGATATVHCYPCGDPQRRDRPTHNDRSRPGLPVHHSGECAALTCYREGGRPERSMPSHSPFDFLKHSIYSPPLFYYQQGAAVHVRRRRSNHMDIHPARRFRHNHKAEINSESSVRERRPLFFSRHFVQFFFIVNFKLDRGTERPVGECLKEVFPCRPPLRVLSGPSVIC